ncbi:MULTISPECIES: DUF819 domain-containing protein [Aminobacterium]|uniref:DUF819 domain-containing protein n=1 Tax=Aminobacterium colombiense (strain DSM 12261 / ALA-1) TaxID=572547 RepID=D5EEV0_AMICL|nr:MULTISPECIES: DUF819 family protein [Aminobacterium]MDD2378283.1 DUF819 family protein [Aminobacterium colombiense]ADE57082.1 protein of unknown function DUF819 [Aminobacterium colombiense DSM 12261]MDD3768279.1 DUF819 family protein [Aminobacterium colombiense]MDD4265778.1 DUF819 family protein [Aminobacterium colombiense]MDD4585131.1 DUF819 family protein [Aminobacterium colombiense]
MITQGFAYFAFLFCFAGIVSTLEMKYKNSTFFKYVPTPVILYVSCMIFATFGLWENNDSIKATYRVIRGNLIPAMIFIMLLRCDIRKILKLGPRMLIGFFSATFTIMIGFVVMFFLMKNGFPGESWKTWGALAGSWIGGTANMVAIQGALGISDSSMGYTLLVDNVNYSIWVILLLASVPYARFFNKWTKTDTSTIDSVGMMLSEMQDNARTKMETGDLVLLVGSGLFVSALSSYGASVLSPMLINIFGKSDFLSVSTVTIIIATFLGIICAMTPMNSIPGSSPVSVTMLYIIICLIASRASFKELTDAPYYLAAGFVVLGIHALLMAIIAKIIKLDLFTCAVASLANIGAVAAAPIIAAAYKETLVPIGVLMALMGYVVGTWGGLFVAKVLSIIAGV